jgi:hypothetical protein
LSGSSEGRDDPVSIDLADPVAVAEVDVAGWIERDPIPALQLEGDAVRLLADANVVERRSRGTVSRNRGDDSRSIDFADAPVGGVDEVSVARAI